MLREGNNTMLEMLENELKQTRGYDTDLFTN